MACSRHAGRGSLVLGRSIQCSRLARGICGAGHLVCRGTGRNDDHSSMGRLRVEGVQRIATRGERTANTDVPDFPDRSYSYSFSTHGALASFRGFARMSSMKTIVIVGSINTDLVMRAPRHALPGE